MMNIRSSAIISCTYMCI